MYHINFKLAIQEKGYIPTICSIYLSFFERISPSNLWLNVTDILVPWDKGLLNGWYSRGWGTPIQENMQSGGQFSHQMSYQNTSLGFWVNATAHSLK